MFQNRHYNFKTTAVFGNMLDCHLGISFIYGLPRQGPSDIIRRLHDCILKGPICGDCGLQNRLLSTAFQLSNFHVQYASWSLDIKYQSLVCNLERDPF